MLTKTHIQTCLTLHFDQFGHVCAEQGIDPLSLSVSVYIQLDVGWETAENGYTQENKRGKENKDNELTRVYFNNFTYPVQGEHPGAVSAESLQHSQWPLR